MPLNASPVRVRRPLLLAAVEARQRLAGRAPGAAPPQNRGKTGEAPVKKWAGQKIETARKLGNETAAIETLVLRLSVAAPSVAVLPEPLALDPMKACR